MYCNYCRSLNPNDAVYCSACGRTIKVLPEQDGKQAKKSPAEDARTTPTTGILSPTSIEESQPQKEFNRGYERMDDDELKQLQEAYQKLRVPLTLGLQHELERRARSPKNSVNAPIHQNMVSGASFSSDSTVTLSAGQSATQYDPELLGTPVLSPKKEIVPYIWRKIRGWFYFAGKVILAIVLGYAGLMLASLGGGLLAGMLGGMFRLEADTVGALGWAFPKIIFLGTLIYLYLRLKHLKRENRPKAPWWAFLGK
jgi:hypothetical protein